MEKLKTTAKSIWAKIPKTKTEFKDLFDTCVSYYKENKAWFHRLCLGIAIALWGFILLAMLSNFFTLYFSGEETPNRASEVRLAVFTLTAWIGAPFLVWRTWIASKQANTAQEKAYTELFTKAVEQLGSVKPVGKDQYEVNIEVRVGAIYALGRIMKDSDKDALTIIDTLCTYVKHNCGKPKKFEKEIPAEEFENLDEDEIRIKRDEFIETLKENPPANRYDIQTALTIIGRRPEKNRSENEMPDLSEVNLQGAKLVKFDLSLCNLANAHLGGADLQWAKLQEADLQRADLYEANLRWAKLQGADLYEANLLRANLLRANLQEAKLHGAYLHEANLQEANLQSAYLQMANLLRANLQEAKLYEAKLYGADLQGANLQEANLYEADLQRAKLQEANLQEADLYGAKLQEANLQSSNLLRANLQDVQITAAHKTAASVIWVDFTMAKYDFYILQEQVMDMFGHKTHTILPEGMKIPDHWSEADIDTTEGRRQYNRDWEAFKKEKGVE